MSDAGVHVELGDGRIRFRWWLKAPLTAVLTHLADTFARRVGRYLERQGLLGRAADNGWLSGDTDEDDPMGTLPGHSITSRIAVGPNARRKVMALQTPARRGKGSRGTAAESEEKTRASGMSP